MLSSRLSFPCFFLALSLGAGLIISDESGANCRLIVEFGGSGMRMHTVPLVSGKPSVQGKKSLDSTEVPKLSKGNGDPGFITAITQLGPISKEIEAQRTAEGCEDGVQVFVSGGYMDRYLTDAAWNREDFDGQSEEEKKRYKGKSINTVTSAEQKKLVPHFVVALASQVGDTLVDTDEAELEALGVESFLALQGKPYLFLTEGSTTAQFVFAPNGAGGEHKTSTFVMKGADVALVQKKLTDVLGTGTVRGVTVILWNHICNILTQTTGADTKAEAGFFAALDKEKGAFPFDNKDKFLDYDAVKGRVNDVKNGNQDQEYGQPGKKQPLQTWAQWSTLQLIIEALGSKTQQDWKYLVTNQHKYGPDLGCAIKMSSK